MAPLDGSKLGSFFRITSCNPVIEMDQPEWGKIQTALEEILDLSQPTPSPDLIRKFVAQIVPEGKTNFQWHLNLDGNQTTHVGMTVEGRKNKAVVSFATEGTCSPPAFGAVIEYPTLCRAAADKNAYLSAMQDRLLSRANDQQILPRFERTGAVFVSGILLTR